MANLRLYDPAVRIYLASPLAFADWTKPTVAELNANPTNAPDGLIWNLTCAVDRADSTFDLDEAEVDDSLSFCQVAGTTNPTSFNPNIQLTYFRSRVPWIISDPSTFNTANLAFSLNAWRGVEYFAIISIGEKYDDVFAVGDRLKMARVGTVDPTDQIGTGEMVRLGQQYRPLGDVAWNIRIES